MVAPLPRRRQRGQAEDDGRRQAAAGTAGGGAGNVWKRASSAARGIRCACGSNKLSHRSDVVCWNARPVGGHFFMPRALDNRRSIIKTGSLQTDNVTRLSTKHVPALPRDLSCPSARAAPRCRASSPACGAWGNGTCRRSSASLIEAVHRDGRDQLRPCRHLRQLRRGGLFGEALARGLRCANASSSSANAASSWCRRHARRTRSSTTTPAAAHITHRSRNSLQGSCAPTSSTCC
jgi:hypothetical protein